MINDFHDWYELNCSTEHFGSHEWLVKGNSHSNRYHPGFGLNTDPPSELWDNAQPLIQGVDQLRDYAKTRIVLTSVYRSPAYNKAIGGASNSYHKKFMAADLIPLDISPTQLWRAALEFRDTYGILNGIGRYLGFVHVDVRRRKADF